MNSLTNVIISKLYNELETNLYSASFCNTKASYSVIQEKLFFRLFNELERRLNITIDNNLSNELSN